MKAKMFLFWVALGVGCVMIVTFAGGCSNCPEVDPGFTFVPAEEGLYWVQTNSEHQWELRPQPPDFIPTHPLQYVRWFSTLKLEEQATLMEWYLDMRFPDRNLDPAVGDDDD